MPTERTEICQTINEYVSTSTQIGTSTTGCYRTLDIYSGFAIEGGFVLAVIGLFFFGRAVLKITARI